MTKKKTPGVLHILPTRESTVDDKKYITFKRDELIAKYGVNLSVLPDEIEDAVVIRTQDAFAGPALHSYAASISIAALVLRENGRIAQADSLLDIADYFSERALEADDGKRKLPD